MTFALALVKRQAEVDAAAKALTKNAAGDIVLWFAYPKGSSKRYPCPPCVFAAPSSSRR